MRHLLADQRRNLHAVHRPQVVDQALGGGLVALDQECPGPLDLLRGRGENLVDDGNLRGMDWSMWWAVAAVQRRNTFVPSPRQ